MPTEKTYHLHPLGWENDPEEERFKLSTLDYLTVCSYNNYALFFRLDDDTDKANIVDVLKAGLERTLSQTRHLCGTIEKDATGGYSFVKKKESTVQFVVQWLNSGLSIDDIEKSHFSTARMGDLESWSVLPMTYGEKPEASLDNSPIVAAYKANFVPGGLVFNMHHHHYSNDVMGWAGLAHQLAENCYAIANNTPFPAWDPKNLDVSRLTKPEPPEEAKVDGPPAPQPHPDLLPGICLLFHLPKSKAAELKTLATPDGTWISTYDAFSAFTLRTLTRLRIPLYTPDPSSPLLWIEAVDMRRRLHTPKPPPRLQGNVMSVAMNNTAMENTTPIPQPNISEILSTWPLSKLASYIRTLTNSVTQEGLDQILNTVAMVRDKSTLNARVDSQPPMTVLQTDHRDTNIPAADFGFGSPITYRHLLDVVGTGLIIIYPPRRKTPAASDDDDDDDDEGYEFAISFEEDIAQTLIEDPEWNRFFEYRGVDAVNAASTRI
ncbi:transferase [Aspergillus cavernicola]|uniref:Transferase n=1 Tax=Aspergillus cavernicola TaxID=176166 RepID=A0ABR4HHU9_9EURO